MVEILPYVFLVQKWFMGLYQLGPVPTWFLDKENGLYMEPIEQSIPWCKYNLFQLIQRMV